MSAELTLCGAALNCLGWLLQQPGAPKQPPGAAVATDAAAFFAYGGPMAACAAMKSHSENMIVQARAAGADHWSDCVMLDCFWLCSLP